MIFLLNQFTTVLNAYSTVSFDRTVCICTQQQCNITCTWLCMCWLCTVYILCFCSTCSIAVLWIVLVFLVIEFRPAVMQYEPCRTNTGLENFVVVLPKEGLAGTSSAMPCFDVAATTSYGTLSSSHVTFYSQYHTKRRLGRADANQTIFQYDNNDIDRPLNAQPFWTFFEINALWFFKSVPDLSSIEHRQMDGHYQRYAVLAWCGR